MAFEQDPFGAGEPGRPPTSEGRPIARKFGRYTLVHRLATGGMAEIWLATHRGVADFVRFVVVKKILSHLSDQPSFVELFLQEARTCALLNHPNIVQIYDLGREGTSYFIAMEYIAGEDLASITKRAAELGQPVPPTFAAKILADASKALHYAHGLTGPDGQPLGIVHRDVSPQNVLVTYEGEVKVVDFGIAFGLQFAGRKREAPPLLRDAAAILRVIGLVGQAGLPAAAITPSQQRLLEIGMALATRPKLLLLDEVAAGLTESEVEDMARLIRGLRDDFGLTVIWIEHAVTTLMRYVERVLVLHQGRKIADAPPHEVVRNAEVVEAYLGDEMAGVEP